MKTIVITGSTRGIGFGLADAFLDRGHAVFINGRSQSSVASALGRLAHEHGHSRLGGRAGDVSQLEQVERIWLSAVDRFDQVDIWINNAGIGHAMLPIWELPPETIAAVVNTNVNGVIYGCRVAMRGMAAQGFGQIYNMLGHGATGNVRDGMGVYGTTKAAVAYLTKALISEARGTSIQIGTLSPGMVKTSLLMDRLNAHPEALARNKRIFNIVTDRVETVAPWLAQKILANKKTGTHIHWLTRPKVVWRFLSAPFVRRDLFEEETPSSP